jgi:precorrin-4/cobalt-precorrin-4 C11-methyltransferase
MQRVAIVIAIIALCAAVATAATAADGNKGMGRFYLIGMGTYPDLVTVRGLEAIKKTDIFLLEERTDVDAWRTYIGDKEVIFCPHDSRVLYGVDSKTITDPTKKALAERNERARSKIILAIRRAVEAGKIVSSLQWGDCMAYGTTFYLEMLPPDFPSEVIPGLGAYEAGSAALKWSPTFGYDTNSVIITMGDWDGRADRNIDLMKHKSSMVVYTCGLKWDPFLEDLKANYPAETPIAVVCFAGVPNQELIVKSTVGKFVTGVDYKHLPYLSIVFVGKFMGCGQARNDALMTGKDLGKIINPGADTGNREGVGEPEPAKVSADPQGLRTQCAAPWSEE